LEGSVADNSQTRPAEPPGGGRQDHDAMRAGATRAATITVPTVAPVPEPIPGEYDRTTVTHREPGAMATSFGEATPSPEPHDWLDEDTAHDRMLEGGGDGEHHDTDGYRKTGQ
jgi:hypothetical protein